jgi:hypothetical protein
MEYAQQRFNVGVVVGRNQYREELLAFLDRVGKERDASARKGVADNDARALIELTGRTRLCMEIANWVRETAAEDGIELELQDRRPGMPPSA